MSQISLKSISGITSITTPAGVDNQLTVHTNDTTERLKVTTSGLNVTGVVTASSFVGDGSDLTGITQTAINNNANNRVITGSDSANTLEGEANMTFNGSILTLTPGPVAGNITSIVLGRTSSAPAVQTTAVVKGGGAISGVPGIIFGSTNTNLPCVALETPNSSNGHIVFKPKGTEKVRITHNGNLKLPDDSKLGLGDVQTSDGDLQLYHDGNNSYITNNTGYTFVQSDSISLAGKSAGQNYLVANLNGEVSLHHSGNQRLTTSDTGVTMDGTGAIRLPVGTTGERPSGSNGMLRYNTSLHQTEEYRNGNWYGLSNLTSVTGGTTTTSGSYTIHTFTSSGTLTVSGNEKSGVDYLLVAGGGGGGSSRAGGGGGGGMTVTTGATLAAGSYTITVGAGGGGSTSTGLPGATGSSTSIGGVASVVGGGGGGGGGGGADRPGKSGGSGGGGSDGYSGGAGTSGQGSNGGGSSGSSGGGGGGGKGGVGNNGDTDSGNNFVDNNSGGNGGNGGSNNYSGSNQTYGAGGGGGSRDDGPYGAGVHGGGNGGRNNSNVATAGSTNRGGGGGGGARLHGSNTSTFYGANGGSGIVIIRYLT